MTTTTPEHTITDAAPLPVDLPSSRQTWRADAGDGARLFGRDPRDKPTPLASGL